MNFLCLELSESFESLQKEVILFTKDNQKPFSIKIYNRAGFNKFEQDLKTVQPRILNWWFMICPKDKKYTAELHISIWIDAVCSSAQIH